MTEVVTFDGHDSVGKTTLIAALTHILVANGQRTLVLRSVSKDFENLRAKHKDLRSSVWFHLTAWLEVEKEIARVEGGLDFILVDRSYFSTLVMARALNKLFPDFLLKRFRVSDFSIWVRLDEETRRKRLAEKNDDRDRVTIDEKLIRNADDIYSQLGMISIWTNTPPKQTAERLFKIISR